MRAHLKMGFLLYNVKGEVKEGMAHLTRALELDPDNAFVNHDLGMALLHQKKFDQAVKHLSEALRRMPQGVSKQYNAVDMHHNLGLALFYCRRFKESTVHLSQAVRLEPGNGKIHYDLAVSLAAEGKNEGAISYYSKAISLKPDVDISPILHFLLAQNYTEARQFQKAIGCAEKALSLARAAGDMQLAIQIQELIKYCQQQVIRERMDIYK